MSALVAEALQRHAAAVEAEFAALLQQQRDAPPRLVEAIHYSLSAGGKRLRPALVLATFDTLYPDAPPLPRQTALQTARASAAAMELIHTFSLVHDDLPAMDDDDTRRGRPTNHKVYGEAMAILAGDAMMTLAFGLIATRAEPDVAPQLIAELAGSAGPGGMIGGQVLDIDGEGELLDLDALQRVHRMKTGALLVCSCRLGAIAARADAQSLAAITEYARHLGLAFQIIDDVLDETATPQQLGKATHKDAARGKNTYPRLLGLQASRDAAGEQVRRAIDAVAPFGQAATLLTAMARFVVERVK